MADKGAINVLMLGAKRAGKSTLLASLVYSLTHGEYSGTLHASDRTVYAPGEQTLADKIDNLRRSMRVAKNHEISPDSDSTISFKEYRVDIDIPGYSGKTSLTFTDGNGEFIELSNSYISDLQAKVAAHDIFLIAIDTPFMMEASNPSNRLCRETTNLRYNQVDAIQNILTYLDDGDGKIPRQVIFVPIKCEKWLKEGRFNEVVDRVKEVYSVALTNLCAYKNIEIGILPVQTVGNLVFTCHRKGFIHSSQRGARRCSWSGAEGNSPLLLAAGGYVRPGEGGSVNIDPRTIAGRMTFPYSWFRVTSQDYSPRNCDILACHVLRFALSKTKENQSGNKINSVWKKSGTLGKVAISLSALAMLAVSPVMLASIAFLCQRMGSIDLGKLEKALQQIDEKSRQKPYSDRLYIVKSSKLTLNQ